MRRASPNVIMSKRKKRVEAVVHYPNGSMIIASVATTGADFIYQPGDDLKEHYTYPPDGWYHATLNQVNSGHSALASGPRYEDLSYHSLATVTIPLDPSGLIRPYKPSRAPTMLIPPPTTRDGTLEMALWPQMLHQICWTRSAKTPTGLSSFRAQRAGRRLFSDTSLKSPEKTFAAPRDPTSGKI